MIYKKEYRKCPICKSDECVRELDYLTNTEFMKCKHCDYNICFTFTNDSNGKIVELDSSKILSLENLVTKEFLKKNPFGILIDQSIFGEITGYAFKSTRHKHDAILDYKNPEESLRNMPLKTIIYRLVKNKIILDIIFKNQYYYRDELPF